VGSSRVVTRQSSETNLQQDARARAWAYVFDCYRKKKAATSPVSRPDDAKGSKHDSRQQHRST
jgi:hypothetical protein